MYQSTVAIIRLDNGHEKKAIYLYSRDLIKDILMKPLCDYPYIANGFHFEPHGSVEANWILRRMLGTYGQYDNALPQSWFNENLAEVQARKGAVWFYPNPLEVEINPWSKHEGPVFMDTVLEGFYGLLRGCIERGEVEYKRVNMLPPTLAEGDVRYMESIWIWTGLSSTSDGYNDWLSDRLLSIPGVTETSCYSEFLVKVDVSNLTERDAFREVAGVREQIEKLRKEFGL